MKNTAFFFLLLNLAACSNNSSSELADENKRLKAELTALRHQASDDVEAKKAGPPQAADFLSIEWGELIALQNNYLGRRVKVPMRFEIRHIGGDAPNGFFSMLVLIPGDGGSRYTYWPVSMYSNFKGKEGRTFSAGIYGHIDRIPDGEIGITVEKFENGRFF